MFNSKGMTHLGFALEKKTKGTAMVMATTANPHRSLLFHASNLAALHHTRCHHHEQREKTIEMGKMERGKKSQPVFEEERRRWTAACPNLPSLLFSSSPSSLSSLDHGTRGWRHR